MGKEKKQKKDAQLVLRLEREVRRFIQRFLRKYRKGELNE